MKKLMILSLAAVGLLAADLAGATEQGKVISSTPVMRRVTEPGKAPEDRLIGYKVVYEYAGKQHTVQLPFAPGPTIELEIQPAAAVSAPAPSTQAAAPQPLYTPGEYIGSAPVYSQPATTTVVTQPVYVQPNYYPVYPSYPSYYSYDPVLPLAIGVGLGYVWRGGCCWGRGWGVRGWHR